MGIIVLVVDRDRDAASGMAVLLGSHQLFARAATTGAEALRLAAELAPDAVLYDLRLVGTDRGLDVARTIGCSGRAPLMIGVGECAPLEPMPRRFASVFHTLVPRPVPVPVLLALLKQLAKSRPAE